MSKYPELSEPEKCLLDGWSHMKTIVIKSKKKNEKFQKEIDRLTEEKTEFDIQASEIIRENEKHKQTIESLKLGNISQKEHINFMEEMLKEASSKIGLFRETEQENHNLRNLFNELLPRSEQCEADCSMLKKNEEIFMTNQKNLIAENTRLAEENTQLTDARVKQIKKFNAALDLIKQGSSSPREQKLETECCICLDLLDDKQRDGDLGNISLSECGHTFHKRCIFSLFLKEMDDSCPLCRTSFSIANVYALESKTQRKKWKAMVTNQITNGKATKDEYTNFFMKKGLYKQFEDLLTKLV